MILRRRLMSINAGDGHGDQHQPHTHQMEALMAHLPHDLARLFPADAPLLRDLKQHDRHFATLCAQFDRLDAEIHADEAGAGPHHGEAHLEALKRERLAVLDALATTLAKARAGEPA
jgi:uncharacterized protein YdcH (DUF465 family)